MPAAELMFKNFYRHPGCIDPETGKDTEWTDVWSATCNDQCPTCGTKDIEPYRSEDA